MNDEERKQEPAGWAETIIVGITIVAIIFLVLGGSCLLAVGYWKL